MTAVRISISDFCVVQVGNCGGDNLLLLRLGVLAEACKLPDISEEFTFVSTNSWRYRVAKLRDLDVLPRRRGVVFCLLV